RLHRREARVHESLELLMEAEAGKDADAGRRVRAREKWNLLAAHAADDLELVTDESFPHRKRIRREVPEDALRELGPGLLAPGHRGVAPVGVLRHVDDVDQPLAALPVERGALPGRLLREAAQQGTLLLRVEGVEETRRGLFLREE